MPFDNPYFPQQFDVGTVGASHIHFAADGSATLYGNDGLTVVGQWNKNLIGVSDGAGNAISMQVNYNGFPALNFQSPNGASIAQVLAGGPGQGVFNLQGPLQTNGAFINLTGDANDRSVRPVGSLGTTGGSSVVIFGGSPDNSLGGLFRVRIRDTAAAFHDMTFDGTTLTVPGTITATGSLHGGNLTEVYDNAAVWIDASGTMQAGGASSYRFRSYDVINSRVIGTYHIQLNGTGAYTAGAIGITLPFPVSGGEGETVIGQWNQAGTGGANSGIIVSNYASTTAWLKTYAGAQLNVGLTGQQFVANFHYTQ